MLDLKTETFLCACRHMNYTRAAEQLHITQSAVSQQIHSLEKYYGVKLFQYEKRTLTLTAAGNHLRSYMEAMRSDILRIRAALQGENKVPELKVGTTMSVGDFFMPEYFVRFWKNNPQLRLSVTRQDTRQILAMLDEGALDFAFVEGNVNKSAYVVQPVKRDEIVAVCGRDYPIGKIREIRDLFSHPLLIREEGSGTREIFLQYLLQTGYDLDSFPKRSVFNSPLLIKEMLLAGCGVSILYRTVVKEELASGALRQIRFPGFSLSHEFSAIWRRESLYSDYYQAVVYEMVK